MKETLRELAVVGQNQQPFRFAVEPADVVEVLERSGQQGKDGFTPKFVILGADEAARLVEHDHARGFRGDAASIDLDVVPRGDLGGRIQAGLAVDLHVTLLDQGVACSSGADAAGGEELVEAGAVIHGWKGVGESVSGK